MKMIRKYLKKIEKTENFLDDDKKKLGCKKEMAMLFATGIVFGIMSMIINGKISTAIAMIMIWSVIGAVVPFYQVKKKVAKVKRSVEMELPDFIDKMALLIESGMQLKEALIVSAMGSEGRFSREICKIYGEKSRTGSVEENALLIMKNISEKLEMSSVSSFTTILTQNLEKGSDTMCEMMRMQAEILRNERKNLIKRMGEEAATYMIFPSIIIFLAIMAMMMAPAIMMLK